MLISPWCNWSHTWVGPFYLCPQHNGTQYAYCYDCGLMRLTVDSLEEMNRLNPRPTAVNPEADSHE